MPGGIAADREGNIYVSDYGSTTLRKITPEGVVTILAGTPGLWGHEDGTGAAARFGYPKGIALDGAGNIYMADSGAIRKITPAGVVTTLAGSGKTGGRADGMGAAARFGEPTGVATDSAGNVYVADTLNNLIRKITPDGKVTTIVGHPGD